MHIPYCIDIIESTIENRNNNNNSYLFRVQYPMYINIQWTYNNIHNNHGRYTS